MVRRRRIQPDKADLPTGRPTRIGRAIAACLILSGCGYVDSSGPSEETAYLDSEVIPQIIAWWAGTGGDFPFSRIAETRGYDEICVIGEYSSLDMVGREVEPITRYHSTFGHAVPENYFALVAIRDGIAHAASSRLEKIEVGGVPGKLCLKANKAVLRRTVGPRNPQPYAKLEPAS